MKIDKNIPMPGHGKGSSVYPFSEMEVGDSFEVALGNQSKVSAAISKYHKDHEGTRFTLRKYNGGYRCWRLPSSESEKSEHP